VVPGDPGLQPERTALAWQRTGVAGSALAGAVMIAAAHLSTRGVLVVVAGLAAGCAAATVVAAWSVRPRASTGPTTGPGRGEPRTPLTRLVAIAAVPVLLAASGCLIALSG
jgi:uncharacterized membrane protein YidH (DUF202 family)